MVLQRKLLAQIFKTAVFATLFATCATAQDSLVPIQDWTSSDGKVIHAELTKFEAGTAQFRTKEGRRYSIPDEKFSLRDQATILIARITDQYEMNYSADINTDFFYSKQVPSDRRRDKIHAYLGFGPRRFNLGIFIPSERIDLRKFDEIKVNASNNQSITYVIDANSITSSGAGSDLWTRVRIDIKPGKNELIIPILQSGLEDKSLVFLAKGKDGEEQFEPSDTERNAIREIVQIYTQTAKLVKAGFIKRELLSTQKPSETSATPMEEASNDDALKPFREQLSQNKYGTLLLTNPNGGEAIEAAGLGYLGTDVVIKNASDEVKRVPFSDLDKASRKKVYEQRVDEIYGKKPFQLDSGTIRYFPPEWEETRMIYNHGFVFSILSDGRPALILNSWSRSFAGVPLNEILVRGNQQENAFSVPCEPAESRKRERGDSIYTTTFVYLSSSETTKLKELIHSNSIELRLKAGAKSSSLSLKDEELANSREAIALYFWHQGLE